MEFSHVYIGRAPCGCIKAASSYNHTQRRECAEHVAIMISDGLIISCVAYDEYRAGDYFLGECPHCKTSLAEVLGKAARHMKRMRI